MTLHHDQVGLHTATQFLQGVPQAAFGSFERQRQALGQLHANAEPEQVLFEIHGLILALHYEARFLHSPGAIERAVRGFDSVLTRYGARAA